MGSKDLSQAGFDEGFIVSKVKRYDCTNGKARHCYGCYQMDETEHGSWVHASDYDEAQEELSALREENERLKSESYEELYNAAIDERDALREELAASRLNEYNAQVNMSEQHDKLTAAEKRNSEGESLVRYLLDVIDPMAFVAIKRAEEFLKNKPTESGASE